MILLGKYDEFASGMGFPSIKDFISDTPYKNKDIIISYLNHGLIHMVTTSLFIDIFTGEQTYRALFYMDDGTYSWSSKLPYYVEKYNLRLPKDFEDHAIKMIDKDNVAGCEFLPLKKEN